MRARTPPAHRQFARAMRREPTDAEPRLWQALKARQLEGSKFRRQVPLKGYIVDFVCFEARLIVEVDGSQHADSAADRVRDDAFAAGGFRTIRFWNDDVLRNIEGVCLEILIALREGASPSLANPKA